MPVQTERQIQNGVAGEVGLTILGIGMVTGMHAAISPSIFTFTCFAKKPEEKSIARKTLFVSLAATTLTSVGLLLVFGRWIPAIASEVVAVGLFGLGMTAVESTGSAPDQPSMAPQQQVAGIGQTVQPELMRVVGWPRIREVA